MRVVIPSSPQRAYGLLLAAIHNPDPVLFLEPARLYRSIRQDVRDDDEALPLDRCFTVRDGTDLTFVTWGAMVRDTIAAAEALAEENISAEVIDVASISRFDADIRILMRAPIHAAIERLFNRFVNAHSGAFQTRSFLFFGAQRRLRGPNAIARTPLTSPLPVVWTSKRAIEDFCRNSPVPRPEDPLPALGQAEPGPAPRREPRVSRRHSFGRRFAADCVVAVQSHGTTTRRFDGLVDHERGSNSRRDNRWSSPWRIARTGAHLAEGTGHAFQNYAGKPLPRVSTARVTRPLIQRLNNP